MDYFFFIFIFGLMSLTFLERLLFGCFIFEDDDNKSLIENKKNIKIDVNPVVDNKINIGVFGRTNSESKIVIRRRKLRRSKTI